MNNISILRTFYYCMLTSRLSTSFIAGFVVFMMLINYDNTIIKAITHGVVFTLVTMYGFIINDIFDYKKDKTAKRVRPIAKDELMRIDAFLFSFLLMIFIFIFEYIFGNINSTLTIIVTIILLTLYSFISKYFPILKGIITSILCLTPIIYVNYLTEIVTSSILYLLVFIFIFGRELYMDAQDLEGDILSNLKTIPYYFGKNFSKEFSFILMISSLLGLFIYSILFFNIINSVLSFISLISCIIAFFISLKNEDKAISLTKITMLLAITSIFYV